MVRVMARVKFRIQPPMLSAITEAFASAWPGSENSEQYRLTASLDGHRGPVNTLAFNTTHLASGGQCILDCASLKRKNYQETTKRLEYGI